MNSRDARGLRILTEYIEPESRFRNEHVLDTIVFFGSARIKESEATREKLRYWEERMKEDPSEKNTVELRRAQIQHKMSRFYDEARELAKMLTEWSITLKNNHHRFLICSGGGPGIMEAANRGAMDAENGKSIGLNISIPMEQEGNPYITDELNFEFHYFFMRKFWFIYLAKALVVFPGGFGTMDEFFEALTLTQTEKLQKKLPIILYGEKYWKNAVNFDFLVENLVINKEDLALFKFVDTPQEAFDYLRDQLTNLYL